MILGYYTIFGDKTHRLRKLAALDLHNFFPSPPLVELPAVPARLVALSQPSLSCCDGNIFSYAAFLGRQVLPISDLPRYHAASIAVASSHLDTEVLSR